MQQFPSTKAEAPGAESQRDTCLVLLAEFAKQGYRKTSMVALAEAAGISRQTLYNWFDSKEAVLDWAATGLVEELRADALAHLGDRSGSNGAVLLDVFCTWLCPIVALLRNGQHGEEILGLSNDKRRRVSADPLEGFTSEISDFLVVRKVCKSRKAADELTFLLAMAAKGLMLMSGSEDEFRSGMARAIRGAGMELRQVAATGGISS